MARASSRVAFPGHRPAARAALAALAMAFLVPVCLVSGGCAAVNPRYDPAKPHHTPTGFRNAHGENETRSLLDVALWLLLGERPKAPAGGWPIPTMRPDLARIHAPGTEPIFTWIGHATLLLQMGGMNILTDPHFTARASPFSWIGPRRHQPPAIALDELPRIDLVLVSHSHYDHLDRGTVRALALQKGGPPVFVVPLGLARWFADEGIHTVVELDWWDRHVAGTAVVHLVPAHHWSARTRLDRNETLWGGFVVEAAGKRFVYTGDTGYAPDFLEIGARFDGFDLAAIPIGAYAPRSFMKAQHVDPAESVLIRRDLRARHAVGVHWGTFTLGDEPLDEPPVKLAEARAAHGLPESAFFTMRIGETRSLDAPGRPGY